MNYINEEKLILEKKIFTREEIDKRMRDGGFNLNVNEFVYHVVTNLFTTCNHEKVYHLRSKEHELVYH